MKENINILILHGWKQNSASMSIFKNKFDYNATLHFLDLPILINNQSLTIEDYIEYIHSYIKNLDNVFIIGHSFGGKLASYYALKYHIKGIILIAPSTYLRKSLLTKIKLILNKFCNILKIKKPRFLLGSKDYQTLNDMEKKTFKNVLKYLSKKELKELDVKTLLIGFKDDKKVKLKDLKYVHKNLRNSKLITYEGDHFAYIDNIFDIAIAIREFIDDCY